MEGLGKVEERQTGLTGLPITVEVSSSQIELYFNRFSFFLDIRCCYSAHKLLSLPYYQRTCSSSTDKCSPESFNIKQTKLMEE